MEGERFVNRKALIDDIVETLSSKNTRIGFALYGKRRVGKTSILLEIRRRLIKGSYVVPVYFSIWDLVDNSVEEFTRKLSIAILEGYKDRLLLKHKTKNLIKMPLEALRQILKDIKLSIRIKNDIEFLLSFSKNKVDNDALIESVFSLCDELANETNTRCVLMIDEFPSIMELKTGSHLGEAIIRKIRTIYERLRHTVLCISGSIRKTMEIAVLSTTSAFYRQLIVKEVKPLSEEDVKILLEHNLKKVSPDALRLVYNFTKGVPFYVQFLGKTLEKQGVVNRNTVNNAIEEFLKEEGNLLFREEFNKLSSKEKHIVIVMAINQISRLTEISVAAMESPSIIQRFLIYLQDKNIVIKQDKNYFLDDPIFEEWIRRRYGE